MNPEIPSEDPPHTRRLPGPVVAVLFALLIGLVIGFDSLWGAVGRAYYQRKIPAELTPGAIAAALGPPAKSCDRSEKCIEFLDAFIFRNPRPEFASYIAYTDHFPLLPVLVFFSDAHGRIVGYDFGKGGAP